MARRRRPDAPVPPGDRLTPARYVPSGRRALWPSAPRTLAPSHPRSMSANSAVHARPPSSRGARRRANAVEASPVEQPGARLDCDRTSNPHGRFTTTGPPVRWPILVAQSHALRQVLGRAASCSQPTGPKSPAAAPARCSIPTALNPSSPPLPPPGQTAGPARRARGHSPTLPIPGAPCALPEACCLRPSRARCNLQKIALYDGPAQPASQSASCLSALLSRRLPLFTTGPHLLLLSSWPCHAGPPPSPGSSSSDPIARGCNIVRPARSLIARPPLDVHFPVRRSTLA